MSKEILEGIIADFRPDKFVRFFRDKNGHFVERRENLDADADKENFKNGQKLGEIKFPSDEKLIVCVFEAQKPLSERSGKKAQYEKAKKILKDVRAAAGIFIFYDSAGNFRFSLIYPEAVGVRKLWSNFRRFTYFVSKEFTNKTFLKRIAEPTESFSSLDKIKEAFSISAVTDIFYNEFFDEYNRIVDNFKKANKDTDEDKARDFVLLFSIRTIFLGFIQKKCWIGNDEKFIQNFLKEYEKNYVGKDLFYKRWLLPLFFQALNSAPGKKVAYGDNDFSKETLEKLEMAPYLNGGLFKEKSGYDDKGYFIPDKEIKSFFEFLFAHNFTIEENSYEDEELQLNPEFLGIIFERLVNKADGAIYTPRTEVDLMCRLSLVKWLQKNLDLKIDKTNFYELFFSEGESEEDQKYGSFSPKEAKDIIERLERITVCDPAVGSGAFLVGMMQVVDEVEQILRVRAGVKDDNPFERKKRIIALSLYGVEVKEWAVWICHLRLWLSLFIEASDDMKNSFEPVLPSLDFKVRQGDSLVQRVGSKAFPVLGHAQIGESVKKKVTQLKNLKNEYFGHKTPLKDWEVRQRELSIYEEILQSEIAEKQRDINLLKNNRSGAAPSLFGGVDTMPSQQRKIDFDREKIEELENEINELVEQKKNIRKDKPLIWNIEFAEIFVESGGFDIIIGNPPYVRQETIADPTGKIKDKKQYKTHLAEMVRLDFPSDFPPPVKINAQSDLYTYFYIRSLRILNPGGIHTFICSNSWLDVGYGAWLQEFLLKKCPIELIIDNHAKRSFKAADVNTIISVIHAPLKKAPPAHLVKFVAFKKPFEESVFTEYMLEIENAEKTVSNEVLRVYPVTVEKLKEAGSEYADDEEKKMNAGKYTGDKWGGKYLRAPDIFFTVLEKGKNKLVRLGDVAKVRRGFTTGVNEFFYLTDAQAKKWKIEKEFLKPVIKSPRECKGILINPKDLKYKIFICNKSKAELKGTNALKYIEWGEKQKTKDGVHWKDVPSVSGRKYWWWLDEQKGNVFWVKEINDRLTIFISTNKMLPDCRLYYADVTEDIGLFCNTTLFGLFSEVMTRSGLGLGARSMMVFEVQNLIIIPWLPLKIANSQSIIFRECKTIFKESGIDPKSEVPIEKQEPKPLPDRAALDKVVFDALGLTHEERKDVYRAVCRLVWNRISKAMSV